VWLYLLRHGQAEEKAGKDDAARALTKAGREDVASVAMAVAPLLHRPLRILSSPYLRAEQTAEIFRETAAAAQKLEPCEQMLPESSWGALRPLLERLAGEGAGAIIAVGHNPSISEMCGTIVGGAGEVRIPLSKGAMACLEIDNLHGRPAGELKWLITPKTVRATASKGQSGAP
jgi:phosphohistidine phosphatase